MSNESEYRDVREALRYTSEALKDATKESQGLALALAKTTTELAGVKKELDRARNDREDFARRLTTLESRPRLPDNLGSRLDAIEGQAKGSEKTTSNVIQYVGVLLAIAAGVMSLVGLLK